MYWGPFRRATNVTSLNFKTLHFTYWGGSHVLVGLLLLYLPLSLSLSQFQSIFVSFVAISSVLCRCFKAMSLLEIYPIRASALICAIFFLCILLFSLNASDYFTVKETSSVLNGGRGIRPSPTPPQIHHCVESAKKKKQNTWILFYKHINYFSLISNTPLTINCKIH